MKNISIFCSASNALDSVYVDTATELGRRIARRGDRLVFGGGQVGLMGAAARGAHAEGGYVIGVIPERLRVKEVAYEASDELIISKGMSDRKTIIIERSDAFVMLAGGYGTLDEFFEALTLKQLRYHHKPIVILNTAGFFDHLVGLFEHLAQHRMIRPGARQLYHVTDTIDGVFDYIDHYDPEPARTQWY